MTIILTNQPNGNLTINGEVNFANVTELQQQGCVAIKSTKSIIVDLTPVQFSDNAILALLIAWLRCANKNSSSIKFINVPIHLMALIKMCGLDQILPLA